MKKMLETNTHTINIQQFQQDLLNWFEKEQRDLPWRKDKDPYKVWVSEVMLQQTKVDTVIPYFHRFIDQFPTITDLANADEEIVLKAWEGLGYYSRARNLLSAVKEVEEQYGGKVPDSPKEISSLRGVGPYTAGAILSIAYDIPEPAVDGNVMRVLSRILLIWEDIAKPSTRKIFEQAVRELISHDNPSFFNQALMELGALICTPTSPSCLLCPVREHCQAFAKGVTKELPVKTRKKGTKIQLIIAIVLENEQGKLLIHKRSSTGLLANLWEFPNSKIVHSEPTALLQLKDFVFGEYGIKCKINQHICNIEHVFSHLTWKIEVYKGTFNGEVKNQACKLVTKQEIEKYAFPVSHQKIFKQYIGD